MVPARTRCFPGVEPPATGETDGTRYEHLVTGNNTPGSSALSSDEAATKMHREEHDRLTLTFRHLLILYYNNLGCHLWTAPQKAVGK